MDRRDNINIVIVRAHHDFFLPIIHKINMLIIIN